MAVNRGSKLLVKHLPSELNSGDKEDLLKHFGATEVICMGRRGKLKNAAIVEFSNSDAAAKAISQLHQLEVLGSRLTVEYAKMFHTHLAAQECTRVSPRRELEAKDGGNERKPASQQDGKEKVKPSKCGMAPDLGIDYLPNPVLHYVYPPPTASVLTNIAHTLACVPRFYVQVLHLMNKMNLPAPFGQITPTPPMLDDVVQSKAQEAEMSSDDDNMSSDESEIESDKEEREKRAKEKAEHLHRMSGSRSEARLRKRQSVKLQLTQPSAKKPRPVMATRHTPVEKAFEQPTAQPKKIEFKLTDAISTIFEAGPPVELAASPTPFQTEGFGTFAPPIEAEDEKRHEAKEAVFEESSEFISSAELRANRMSAEEMAEMSALRKYSPGDPTCRLYIKNLAKHVQEKDLLYIFGRYVNHDVEEEKDRFDIRLMKEGRMKGQAFVTLPSEDKAKRALREAHGYILHGKPIVIQFARSAKAKE